MKVTNREAAMLKCDEQTHKRAFRAKPKAMPLYLPHQLLPGHSVILCSRDCWNAQRSESDSSIQMDVIGFVSSQLIYLVIRECAQLLISKVLSRIHQPFVPSVCCSFEVNMAATVRVSRAGY